VAVIPNKPLLAILVFHEPSGDGLCEADGRGVAGSGKSTNCSHWVPLYSHAWIASQSPETRITRWGCVEVAPYGPARVRGASLARRVSGGPRRGPARESGGRLEHGSGVNGRNPGDAVRQRAEPGIRGSIAPGTPKMDERSGHGANRQDAFFTQGADGPRPRVRMRGSMYISPCMGFRTKEPFSVFSGSRLAEVRYQGRSPCGRI
jgi:hypothetical protein